MNNHVVTDVKEREQIATRVSTVGIVGNVVLTVFKLIAGIVANSGAMVSDAIHSASDVFSTIIVMIGADGQPAPVQLFLFQDGGQQVHLAPQFVKNLRIFPRPPWAESPLRLYRRGIL